MAPKRSASPKRSSSPAPKGKAKAKPEAKAKAEAPKVPLIPKFNLTAEQVFDKYKTETADEGSEEKEFVIKLKEFAQCVRDANELWDDVFDGDPPIKEQWREEIKGFKTKQATREDFLEWLPKFSLVCEKTGEERKAKFAEEERKRAEKEAQAIEDKKKRRSMYEGDGIWSINLKQLEEAMDAATDKGKTPLILDSTEGHRSEVYFQYNGTYVIEAKEMIMKKATKKLPVEEILEEQREKFFRARVFKTGNTLMFRLANSAIDINKQFSSDTFPVKDLLDAEQVNKCTRCEDPKDAPAAFENSPFYKMCVTSDDKSDCFMGINSKFRVIALSHFEDADYEGYLKDAIPLNKMQPIRVTVD